MPDIILNTTFTRDLPFIKPDEIEIFSDTFSREDTSYSPTGLGSAETGQAWTLTSNTNGQVLNNAGSISPISASSAQLLAYIDAATHPKVISGEASATTKMVGSFMLKNWVNSVAVYVRAADSLNGGMIVPTTTTGGQTWHIMERKTGSGIVLLDTRVPVATGQTVEWEIDGSSLTIYVDGGDRHTANLTATVGSKYGFGGSGSYVSSLSVDHMRVAYSAGVGT